jgi:hypothetical protein
MCRRCSEARVSQLATLFSKLANLASSSEMRPGNGDNRCPRAPTFSRTKVRMASSKHFSQREPEGVKGRTTADADAVITGAAGAGAGLRLDSSSSRILLAR